MSTQDFEVDMPHGGGVMHLHSAEEVELWERLAKSYKEEHQISVASDLVMVGTLLTQQIRLYRGQQLSMGRKVRFDDNMRPTGEYERVDPDDQYKGDVQVDKAQAAISKIEDTLGISKKAREAGGANTIAEYVTNAKTFAHEYGVHIVERVTFFEGMAMKVKTLIRILDNLDEEDRAYHNVTEQTIIDLMRQSLAYAEEKDKEWAREKGVLFRGSMN